MLTSEQGSFNLNQEDSERLSMKGWREPNKRQKVSVSKRMVRTFSFMHSIEVLAAKMKLRIVRAAFGTVKDELSRPRDTRALRVIKSRLIKRLNKITQPLTAKKAFMRWRVVIDSSYLQHSIEKIYINSRINYMVAMYRLLKITRKRPSAEERYEELYHEAIENLIKRITKYKDKYNAVDTLCETSFNRIKDHNIRCSRLIALEYTVRRVIDRSSAKSYAVSRIRHAAIVKTRAYGRLVRSCIYKMSDAWRIMSDIGYRSDSVAYRRRNDVLVEEYYDLTDLFKNRAMDTFTRMVQNAKNKACAALLLQDCLVQGCLKKSYMVLDTMRNNQQWIIREPRSVDEMSPKPTHIRKRSQLPILNMSDLSDMDKNDGFLCSPRNSPKKNTRNFDSEEKVIMKTVKVLQIDVDESDPIKKGFILLEMFMSDYTLCQKINWYNSFETFAKIKRLSAMINAMNKWKIKSIGDKSRADLNKAAKSIIAGHIISKVMTRANRPFLKPAMEAIKFYAYIEHQINLPLKFTRHSKLFKQLKYLILVRRKTSFYMIMFYSHMNNSVISKTTVRRTILNSIVNSAAEVGRDLINDVHQSKRVRKAKIRPILTGFNAEDHRPIVDKIMTLTEYEKVHYRQEEMQSTNQWDEVDLLANPCRNSNAQNSLNIYVDSSDSRTMANDDGNKMNVSSPSSFPSSMKTPNTSMSRQSDTDIYRPSYIRSKPAPKISQPRDSYVADEMIDEEIIDEFEEIDHRMLR